MVYSSANYKTNWQAHSVGVTNVMLNSIAYGNGHFVAVANGGGIFLSGPAAPAVTAQNQAPVGVQLTITGGLGPTYRLQASTDLSTWTNLTNFTNIVTNAQYLDTNASNFALRYYRTVSP